MISRKKINEVINRIVNNCDPEKIILFGSQARGNQNKDSDLDIMIIKDSNLPLNKRGRTIRKHLRGLAVPIDIVVKTPEEIDKWKSVTNSFIKTVMDEGKILYDKGK